ncbi:hypothetical protein [Rhodococcus sp. ACS1]|uniref:hypothetical protein n=1 Tax=Rhodococcus sp. ACS1 TaxID=2028570 RepID=UPI00117AF863|nr:hypothetical protein [Rhodococcus sp. ACS1]
MTAAPPSWIELMGRHAASTLLYLSGSLTYRYVSHTGTVEDGAWEFLQDRAIAGESRRPASPY